MAGKGRGVAAFTFNIEALGIGRGNMPEARVAPNPLFPPVNFKPIPLKVGEDEDYMLALKQEMRGTMQQRPHNIRFHSKKADVEKYTQRYVKQTQDEEWTPDWNVFPKELMPQKKTKVNAGPKKKGTKVSKKEAEDVLTKLNELEKKDDGDKSDEDKPKNKDNEGEEEEEIEEEQYEEDEVEDNDYIESYFDNGEDFGAGSDDNMDGEATY
ncbi:DNA-directed RNA polymerase III subunit RPC7 [Hippocampus zosterae]|uniref:DNA-directed RNA polymerase III subunit RPC7 n=1 Tax=Hippocampus zosterae TaxID=109293 RepID=UPI00223E4FBA|nr:DNA-directed RNA polymerase III subunit RPC7 [Hippocampus zosterae]